MSGGGDAAQTDELAAAAHRLAALADRIRDLRNRLAGVPPQPSVTPGTTQEAATEGAKGDAR
jgi:hypothetical protein